MSAHPEIEFLPLDTVEYTVPTKPEIEYLTPISKNTVVTQNTIEYITIHDESGRIPEISTSRTLTPTDNENKTFYCKVDHERTKALEQTMTERKLSFSANSPPDIPR